MSSLLVTCHGKKGSSFTYIISGKEYAFRGGSTMVVDESVMEVLKKAKAPNGKALFSAIPVDNTPEEVTIEKSKIEEITPIDMEIVNIPESLELKEPPSAIPKTTNMQTKLSNKKVQGKLI